MTAGTDRRPVALVAAAVLATVVVGLVLTVGVVRPPSLATIADDPAVTPPGRAALYGRTGGESCLTIVTPGGASDQPWCSQDGADLVGWTDDGVVLRTYGAAGDLELVIDPEDGEVLASGGATGDRRSSHESVVTTSRLGGNDLEVRLRDGTVLWRTRAPDGYRISGGWISPDGRSVALTDNAGRLLIVPADGSDEPRIWVGDVDGWHQFAWQGSGRG
ncbi:hypothetical protein [Nitriliruptor alkaliphilus]|uniref:hypothetical protein n=1 Tax=Nitriliruptor alkaliphilus TaxID=427918 RepID=UPI0006982E29|nr:hypothetical protein [Nitriliruptor alkaliphilus]